MPTTFQLEPAAQQYTTVVFGKDCSFSAKTQVRLEFTKGRGIKMSCLHKKTTTMNFNVFVLNFERGWSLVCGAN